MAAAEKFRVVARNVLPDAPERPPRLPPTTEADRLVPPRAGDRRATFLLVLLVSLGVHAAILAYALYRNVLGEERAAGGSNQAEIIEGITVELLDNVPSPPAPPIAKAIDDSDIAEAMAGDTAPVERPDTVAKSEVPDEVKPSEVVEDKPPLAPDHTPVSEPTAVIADEPAAPLAASPADMTATAAEPASPLGIEEKPAEILDATARAPVVDTVAEPAPVVSDEPRRVADQPITLKPAKEPPKPKPAKPPKKAAPSSPAAAASTAAPAARGLTPGKAGAGGSSKDNVGKASLASYHAKLSAHLRNYRSYPEEARRRGLTGTASVSFTLNARGAVLSVRILRSTGQPVLDSAALAMVRRASPFPPIPPGMGATITVQAPVRFDFRKN